MVDPTFVDTISSALTCALVSTAPASAVLTAEDRREVERVSRRAAWQLLFDLDGQSLLELAMAKLSVEQDSQLRRAA